MMGSADDGREMLTAQQVREITGVPVSTLHDWAAKRERGIDAPGPHHLRLSGRHRRRAVKELLALVGSARVEANTWPVRIGDTCFSIPLGSPSNTPLHRAVYDEY